MRLSLTRRLLCSGSRRLFFRPERLQTPSDRYGVVSQPSWVVRSYSTPPPSLEETIRAIYGEKTRNEGRSTPTSLAEALQEEEITMREVDDELGEPTTEPADVAQSDEFLRPSQADRKDPDAWMLLLEQFLPKELQITNQESNHSSMPTARARAYILRILKLIRLEYPHVHRCDLLVHMGVRHGRWNAVSWLADFLLKGTATRALVRSMDETPSNIAWPSLTAFDRGWLGIDVEPKIFKYTYQPSVDQWLGDDPDPRYSDTMSATKDETMAQIWSSLGCIIVESKEMSEENANQAMSVVYRIIAQIHNSDLIPDNVYSYIIHPHASSIKRPAILHLLSSRILSTLSDAVWRSHQDEAIAQATRLGAEYKDISNDPPGGRFRLKVQPLGPEVWLEFVLWCCADGGFTTAGLRIIELMQQNTENPWFAVDWTSKGESNIDWARVMLRHGGTVGQIEGYSSERPFAEMQPRTISAEVVLSLIESTINSANVGVKYRGSNNRRTTRAVKSLVEFLEPHSLPLQYFDYLATRLAQSGAFDLERDPKEFLSFVKTISSSRALETTVEKPRLEPSLDLDSILLQSELHAGLLHQCLDGLVAHGDVLSAIEVFSTIQESVDNSKLESINSFLNTSTDVDGNSQPPKPNSSALEYVRSHGQLPPYRMAGFLSLVTDSKLTRLGRWLIDSEDVDGPSISIDRHSSLSAPLLRFAALSKDLDLRDEVISFRPNPNLKPSLNFLRTQVDTHLSSLDISSAIDALRQTTTARAGGYRPSNLAQIFAMILRLEAGTIQLETGMANQKFISDLTDLAQRIFEGVYDGIKGDFNLQQLTNFRREVGCILVVASSLPSPTLNLLVESWRDTYGSGDGIGLRTSTFNILIGAAVEAYGAREGQKLWVLFCEDQHERFEPGSPRALDTLMVPEIVRGEDGDKEEIIQYFVRRETPKLEGGYVPIVRDPVPDLEDTTDTNAGIEHAKTSFSKSKLSNTDADTFSIALPFASTGFGGFSLGAPDQSQAHAQSQAPGGPLVAPSLRTLRLIVRGALAEPKEGGRLGEMERLKLLRWAAELFRAFGLSGGLVDAEVQVQGILGFNWLGEIEEKWRRKKERRNGVRRGDVGGKFRRLRKVGVVLKENKEGEGHGETGGEVKVRMINSELRGVEGGGDGSGGVL